MTELVARREKGSAALLLPRPAMAGCIVLAIARDTRGRSLSDRDRFNHFPLSPYCALTWHFEGQLCLVETDAEKEAPETALALPRLMVSGPGRTPVTTWNPGEIFALTIGFYPDVWRALTGTDVAPIVGRHLPGEEALPPDILGPAQSVFEGGSVVERFALFEELIAPLWAERRPGHGKPLFWMRDWTTALATRVALSGTGRSLRQLQRRIKKGRGRTQRELALLVRNEELFARVMTRDADGSPDYAGLATEAGYADQAHMGREVRRMTGMPPAKIVDLIEKEESYWPYRLLGERYA